MIETLDGIRSEVNRRVLACHPEIILEALENILQEIAGAHEEVRSGICSYQINFHLYRSLRCRVTFLRKRLDISWVLPGKIATIESSLSTIDSNLRALRMKRYENVCGKCESCKTRRRQWPECTKFTSHTPKPDYLTLN